MTRPEGETNKERRSQRIVGLGVVLIFVLLSTNLLSGIANYRSQTAHHAATTKQQNKIILQGKVIIQQNKELKSAANAIAGLGEQIVSQDATIRSAQEVNEGTIVTIKALETEVAGVIAGLPSADAELASFARWLEICVQDHSVNCPAPPIPTGE